MRNYKIQAIGNSYGIILSKEDLARLHVGKGDVLYGIETPDGLELSPYNMEFEEQIEVAERIMREDRDILRKLSE